MVQFACTFTPLDWAGGEEHGDHNTQDRTELLEI